MRVPSPAARRFFRVLESGFHVEFLFFRTADRLQRAIAINAVIAWRIMVMTLLGRQVPDCDPQLMFADQELGFLRDYALEHGLDAPERLGDAVRLRNTDGNLHRGKPRRRCRNTRARGPRRSVRWGSVKSRGVEASANDALPTPTLEEFELTGAKKTFCTNKLRDRRSVRLPFPVARSV